MEFDFAFVGMIVSIGVSMGLLYFRRRSWNTDTLRWSLCGGLFLIGIWGLFYEMLPPTREFHFFFWSLLVPLLSNSANQLFRAISQKFQGRDFYLYLRGSADTRSSWGNKNPDITWLDKLFSLLLICIIMGSLILGMK